MSERLCPVCGKVQVCISNGTTCKFAAENKELIKQINRLAKVLIDEFNGPDSSESACDMAIKILRQALENDTNIKAENVGLRIVRNNLAAENARLKDRDQGTMSRPRPEPRLFNEGK